MARRPSPHEIAPGARLPSLILNDGTAVLDLLGEGFALLRMPDVDSSALERAASTRGVPLDVVDIRDEKVRVLFERELILTRPDGHVAWRGAAPPSNALALIDQVRGAEPPT